jgi:hypothetical protein
VLRGKRRIPLNAIGQWIRAFKPPTPELRDELIAEAISHYASGFAADLREAAAQLLGDLRLLAQNRVQIPDSLAQSMQSEESRGRLFYFQQ